ncbi:TolC family outer membrane protein [Pseudovibrio exalbescens]|uniref:Type I secretion protein TolC n=1 Tax=Pseudovibrio exalbescens TaxID=197461 RepID=A0A1U7JMC1_9HYPH|nr:TolC family outer membrane protein [Pseudovibrio exalbescens]OKL45842.1 type I secretion protein TolC [Pseudovibrio exalbescens]
MKFRGLTLAVAIALATTVSAHAISLRDAVEAAVYTNPDVAESSANRRARDQELRAAQGAYLPSLSVGASIGGERLERPDGSSVSDNAWRTAKQVDIMAEQLLFDGFGSVNEIYRQSARVDGAAYRVLERSEAVALDAIEAYVDVIRHQQILRKSRENTAKHQRIYNEVRQRFEGGETGAADLAQAQERVAATKIITASVRKSLLETIAKYRRVVGMEPENLVPVQEASLPGASLSATISMAQQNNPQILAAQADTDAADFEVEQRNAPFLPRLSLEGQASFGDDVNGYDGQNEEYRVMLRMRWNLYNGGSDTARKAQALEQVAEARARVDRTRREAAEAVEVAWASVDTTRERISALRQTVAANRKVVEGYRDEYNIGQRTLLDLLNAQNALFNSEIDLISAQAILKFSTYQLQGTTGNLLAHFNIEPPAEGAAGRQENVSVFPQPVGFAIEPLR